MSDDDNVIETEERDENSSIRIENLSGTLGKKLSKEAQVQAKRFLLPIQYIFITIVILVLSPIIYHLMKYFLQVESIPIALGVSVLWTIVGLKAKKNKNIKLVFNIIMTPIIFYFIFKYIFYVDYIKSLGVIFIIALAFALYVVVFGLVFEKLKTMVIVPELTVFFLLIIRYIQGRVSEPTLIITCILSIVLMGLMLIVYKRKPKDKFMQLYKEQSE